MKTQGKDGRLPATEGGLGRNQPCQHLDPGLLASTPVRKQISVVCATQSVWCFVTAALANKYIDLTLLLLFLITNQVGMIILLLLKASKVLTEKKERIIY